MSFTRLLSIAIQAGPRYASLAVLAILLGAPCAAATETHEAPSGNAEIRGRAGGSEIVIRTTTRTAGAIDSLTWNGKEFINTFDHGRQLQSASSFDAGSKFIPETFNPTEAGSSSDGVGPTSTSRLLHLVSTPRQLQTTTQMAFWLKPGDKSFGHPAKNTAALSNHLLTKRIWIGHQIGREFLPHVIAYDVTFSVPVGETHAYAQFEVLTGYMPPEFQTFWTFNPATAERTPLSDGPGEQDLPIIFSTPDGSHAMGVYCPPQKSHPAPARYGRFRFTKEKVNKWNCVYRVNNARGIAPGEYSFQTFVLVGDLATVQESMQTLHAAMSPGRPDAPRVKSSL